jgi:hypothetical protein
MIILGQAIFVKRFYLSPLTNSFFFRFAFGVTVGNLVRDRCHQFIACLVCPQSLALADKSGQIR